MGRGGSWAVGVGAGERLLEKLCVKDGGGASRAFRAVLGRGSVRSYGAVCASVAAVAVSCRPASRLSSIHLLDLVSSIGASFSRPSVLGFVARWNLCVHVRVARVAVGSLFTVDRAGGVVYRTALYMFMYYIQIEFQSLK